MNVWKIIRFVIIVGCIVGAYAYMGSVTSKRDTARSIQKMQRSQALEKIQETKKKKERELKRQKEDEGNADNAKYQLNCWFETYNKLMSKWEVLTSRMSSSQVRQLKHDLRDAWEHVLFWDLQRCNEIVQEKENYNKAKEDDEYQRLKKIEDTLLSDGKNKLDDEEIVDNNQNNIENHIRQHYLKYEENRVWDQLASWVCVRAEEYNALIENAVSSGDDSKKEYYQEKLKILLNELKDKTGIELRFENGKDPLNL